MVHVVVQSCSTYNVIHGLDIIMGLLLVTYISLYSSSIMRIISVNTCMYYNAKLQVSDTFSNYMYTYTCS